MTYHHSVVSITVPIVLVVAQLGVLMHALAREGWRPTLSYIRASCWHLKTCFWPATGSCSETERVIRHKIAVIRVDAFKRMSRVVAFSLCLILLSIFYRSLFNSERYHSIMQDVLIFTAQALLLLIQCRPSLVNSSTVGLWHCCLSALGVLYVAPGICTRELAFWSEGFIMLMSFVLSISNLSVQCAVVCQSALTASLAWQYLEPYSIEDRTFSRLSLLLMQSVGICVFTDMLANCVHWTLRNDLEAGVLAGKQSAGNALLKIFYDVVLEVDTSLTIVGITGNLGSFLQSSTGKSFQNIGLRDLLPQDADKERIVDFMQRAPGADEPDASLANVLHVVMMGGEDTDGLEVELFSFRFKGPCGQSHHLIGLREFTDDKVALGACPPSFPEHTEALGAMTVVPSVGPPWFRVETTNATYPVLACNASFQSLLGLTGNNTTLQTLTPACIAVMRWTQGVVNMRMAREEPTEEDNTFTVLLSPQSGTRERLRATLNIDLGDLADVMAETDLSDGATLPVVFVLQKMKRVKVKRRDGVDGSEGSSSLRSARSTSRGTPQHAGEECVGRLCSYNERQAQSL